LEEKGREEKVYKKAWEGRIGFQRLLTLKIRLELRFKGLEELKELFSSFKKEF